MEEVFAGHVRFSSHEGAACRRSIGIPIIQVSLRRLRFLKTQRV